MIDFSNFSMFLITSIAVILMPGPAMLFVIANGLTKGTRASVAAALGTTTGVSFHLFCAAFGLAVLLKTSMVAFSMVKFAGAGYLFYIAIRTLMDKEAIVPGTDNRETSGRSIFRQGILINILNPKLPIFFLAFLPQFIDSTLASTTMQTLILGAIFMGMTIVLFIGYGACASSLRVHVLNRPRVLKTIRLCFTSVFMVLGIRLALSKV